MLVDIVYVASIGIVVTLAAVTNYLSAYIFSSRHFKTVIFKYLALNSVVDGTLVLTTVFVPFLDPTSLSSGNKSYPIQFYRLYGILYLSHSLELFSTMISIKVAIHRFLLIRMGYESSINKSNFKLMSLIMFAVSFACQVPIVFSFHIVNTWNNSTNATSYDARKIDLVRENAYVRFGYYLISYTPNLITFSLMLFSNFALLLMIVDTYRKKREMFAKHLCHVGLEFRNQFRILRRSELTRRRTMAMVLLLTALNSTSQLIIIFGIFNDTMNVDAPDLPSKQELRVIHWLVVVSRLFTIAIFYTFNHNFAVCLRRFLLATVRLRKPVL
jgi:hypothetical protein